MKKKRSLLSPAIQKTPQCKLEERADEKRITCHRRRQRLAHTRKKKKNCQKNLPAVTEGKRNERHRGKKKKTRRDAGI